MSDVNYTRINWEDKPSTATPINAENLNKMDKGISDCVTEVNSLKNSLGSTDISLIGDGKVTGAISQLNNDLTALKSHVGMIIQSTTLDTEAKVIAIYGGTTWTKIEGRFLLGASEDYAVNSTGGEATHTLTIDEMPAHTHNYTRLWPNGGKYWGNPDGSNWLGSNTVSTTSTGGGQAHNNMPPYKAVYIWERIA